MAPSQLKRLKASLRESGVFGPQKSKKQKKQAVKNGAARDGRVQRNVALQGVREQFKPFDIKAPARPTKFEVTDNRAAGRRVTKNVIGRPGITKGLGEENVGSVQPSILDGSLTSNDIATKNSSGGNAATQKSGWYSGSTVW